MRYLQLVSSLSPTRLLVIGRKLASQNYCFHLLSDYFPSVHLAEALLSSLFQDQLLVSTRCHPFSFLPFSSLKLLVS